MFHRPRQIKVFVTFVLAQFAANLRRLFADWIANFVQGNLWLERLEI
jgi:hypothetical protein